MKSLLTLCLLLSFIGLARAQSTDALDQKNGFRSATFGDSLSHFQQMKLVEDDGASKFYARESDDLNAGGVHLQAITYGFYKGQLQNVMVRTKGLANSRSVLQILQAAYGAGSQPNEYIERYNWFGHLVVLTYEENSATGDGTIWYTSRALQSQEESDKENDAKGASGKF